MNTLFLIISLFTFQLSQLDSDKRNITDEVLDRITEEVQTVYQGDNYRFSIIPKRIPGDLESNATSIEQVSYIGQNMPKGYSTFTVIYHNGSSVSKANVQVFIEVNQKLPVPSERISKGTHLSANLFSEMWVDITQIRGSIITKVNEVDGYVASGILFPGRPIRPSDLMKEPVVRPGNTISMIYNKDGIELVLAVTSRQDGAKKDEIRVYCEETRKTYLVRILNKGEALWLNTL